MNKRQNWGKFQTWFPKETLYPESLEELRQIILKTKTRKGKIRLAGSLHSFNDLCATDETQVHTDKLNHVLSLDIENLRVRVQCGIKIKHLLEYLAKNHLTLPNQGYIDDQSIAGAIATATHGSGKTGTLSSFVEELKLLDANGILHSLSPTSNPHLFSAATVNLGCLGIVYSVTLKCIPLEKLQLAKVKSTLKLTLRDLPELLQMNEYFQFIIDPYSDTTICWLYQKTKEKVKGRLRYRMHWLLNKILAVSCFDLFPIPWWLLPSMIKIYTAASAMKSCVDYSYKLLSPADEGHYIEEEIAVPLEDLEEALTTTRQIINKYSEQKTRMVVVILIRFAQPDLYGYLSPALKRQTAYISLITIAKNGYQELFKEVETSLYCYQGRPHWGKVNCLTKETITELYGTNYINFLQARKELDPEGLFSNGIIDKHFNVLNY